MQHNHDDLPDLRAIRLACKPVTAWWDHYLTTGEADPHRLDEALEDARALGPTPGRIGEALTYILGGCLSNLEYSDVAAAFQRVAAAGRGMSLEHAGTIVVLVPRTGPPVPRAEQLELPGI
jgi:hypothetical protein